MPHTEENLSNPQAVLMAIPCDPHIVKAKPEELRDALAVIFDGDQYQGLVGPVVIDSVDYNLVFTMAEAVQGYGDRNEQLHWTAAYRMARNVMAAGEIGRLAEWDSGFAYDDGRPVERARLVIEGERMTVSLLAEIAQAKALVHVVEHHRIADGDPLPQVRLRQAPESASASAAG